MLIEAQGQLSNVEDRWVTSLGSYAEMEVSLSTITQDRLRLISAARADLDRTIDERERELRNLEEGVAVGRRIVDVLDPSGCQASCGARVETELGPPKNPIPRRC